MSIVVITEHHWSGWPGAYCIHCGASDPMEEAIAEGWFDTITRTWDTVEHAESAMKKQVCVTWLSKIEECPQCIKHAKKIDEMLQPLDSNKKRDNDW